MQHYQVKVSEYGQLCFRAPNEPEIVGFLWRINEWKGKSGTGYFGQVALFPSAMNPSMNTNIDYRVNGEIFTAAMPDFPISEYGEYLPEVQQWQWIEAEPGEYDETMWYELDKPDAPPQDWKAEMEYDMWLLDEPGPAVDSVEVDLVLEERKGHIRPYLEGQPMEIQRDVLRVAIYGGRWQDRYAEAGRALAAELGIEV